MDIRLIESFKATVDDSPKVDPTKVNAEAVKRGYFVTEAACNQDVLKWLQTTEADVNSTFYKEWKEVKTRSRVELFIDQVLHYITTYGTNFESEFVYTRNDGQRPSFKFDRHYVIDVITKEELLARCLKMLSGSALKQETMEAVADYVIANQADINVDAIANKEAQVYICEKTDRVPSTPQAFLRYLVYVATGETLLIKNARLYQMIMEADSSAKRKCAKAFAALTEEQMVNMAGSFYRYKPIFLAFRHIISLKTRKNVNRIRQLARKHHKPVYAPADHAFDPAIPLDDVKKAVAGLTPFKKVSIWRSANMRIDSYGQSVSHAYVVRNGKVHYEHVSKKDNQPDFVRLQAVRDIVRDSIVETVRSKRNGSCIVRLPDTVHIALPTSEKNFIGDYPFGTTIDVAEHNVFGIYWRNEWGTYDYDLSMRDNAGHTYGWNSSYYNDKKSIVYSGDMVSAEPEAAECMYVSGDFIKKADRIAYLCCNQYNGSPRSKFKAFFSRADKCPPRGAMVDPSTIVVEGEIRIAGKMTLFGVISKDKVALIGFNYGNSIVGSQVDATSVMEELTRMAFLTPTLSEVLTAAGYTVVDSTYEGEVDLDFSKLTRDSLIDFIS